MPTKGLIFKIPPRAAAILTFNTVLFAHFNKIGQIDFASALDPHDNNNAYDNENNSTKLQTLLKPLFGLREPQNGRFCSKLNIDHFSDHILNINT